MNANMFDMQILHTLFVMQKVKHHSDTLQNDLTRLIISLTPFKEKHIFTILSENRHLTSITNNQTINL